MSNWIYHGKEITDEDVPKKAIGFIYMITHITTGRRYIGKKLLTKSATKQTNGVKKKIRKESDWKTYFSSSPTLQALVAEEGEDKFKREILVFCSSKGSVAYLEELALFQMGVLESDDWENKNIRSRIYASWVKRDEAQELRSVLSQLSSSSSTNSLVSS